MGFLDRILRAGEGKKVKALASLVPDINVLEPEIAALLSATRRHEFRRYSWLRT